MTAPNPIDYLDRVAASDAARAYKPRLLAALDVRAGQVALDVGCGPGTDLADLAAQVTPAGRVIGIDANPAMVAAASARLADAPHVHVRVGDAHELPLPDRSVDRARTDRVLMHLTDPARALAELRRVLRPGGLVTLAEPDWDTLAIDAADLATSRAYGRFMADRFIRHGTIGRQLSRLATAAGFTVREAAATTPVLGEFATADALIGLRRNTEAAVAEGYLDAGNARDWLDGLSHGPFQCAFSVFTVLAEAG
jgi:ubiquinone/menaquinone biosynthesis C-methylase UbiE